MGEWRCQACNILGCDIRIIPVNIRGELSENPRIKTTCSRGQNGPISEAVLHLNIVLMGNFVPWPGGGGTVSDIQKIIQWPIHDARRNHCGYIFLSRCPPWIAQRLTLVFILFPGSPVIVGATGTQNGIQKIIRCYAEGIPPPNIKYYWGDLEINPLVPPAGHRIDPVGPALIILRETIPGGVPYKCRAFNEFGVDVKSFSGVFCAICTGTTIKNNIVNAYLVAINGLTMSSCIVMKMLLTS